jgi:hypothetical protein
VLPTQGAAKEWARVRATSPDIEALSYNVDRWALRAVPLTERPPELFRFPLPSLIVPYWALSARARSTPSSSARVTTRAGPSRSPTSPTA